MVVALKDRACRRRRNRNASAGRTELLVPNVECGADGITAGRTAALCEAEFSQFRILQRYRGIGVALERADHSIQIDYVGSGAYIGLAAVFIANLNREVGVELLEVCLAVA